MIDERRYLVAGQRNPFFRSACWAAPFCALFALIGCTSSQATCVAGGAVACACPDGTSGAQVCQSDGTFGPCTCSGHDAGAGMDVGLLPDGGTSGDTGGGIDGAAAGCGLVAGDSYLPVDTTCPNATRGDIGGIAVIRYYVSNVDSCMPGDYAAAYGHMDVACSTWEQAFPMGSGDTMFTCDGLTYSCHVAIDSSFHVDCILDVPGGASCRITFSTAGMVLVDAGR